MFFFYKFPIRTRIKLLTVRNEDQELAELGVILLKLFML